MNILHRLAQRLAPISRNALIPAFFVLIVILFGGASDPEVGLQPILQILAAVMLIWMATGKAIEVDGALDPALKRLRIPFGILIGFMGIGALQLVPLPPVLWHHLPGRDVFADVAELAGMTDHWRPIALMPARAALSWAAPVVPLAAILAIRHLDTATDLTIARFVLYATVVGLVFGYLQVASGNLSFQPYELHTELAPNGIFANRNHFAVFLVTSLLIVIGMSKNALQRRRPVASVLPLLVGLPVLILPLLLATGSRQAALLLPLVLAFGIVMLRSSPRASELVERGGAKRIMMSAGVMAIALIFALVALRSNVFTRFELADYASEKRFQLLGPMFEMVAAYFPFGTGAGSFAAAFQIWEPTDALAFEYFNHAHNDVLEIVIEYGVFGVGLLAAFAIWWCHTTLWIWRLPMMSTSDILARVGCGITFILMIASLVDYPLRTATLATLFAVSIVWMTRAARPDRRSAAAGGAARD